jgi:hypothetical protein
MMKLEDILSKLTGVSKETPVIDVLKGIKNDISVISDTFKQPEQSALIKLLRGDKNTEQAPSKNLITKVLDTLKNVGKFSAVKDNVVANDSKGSVGTPLTVTTSSSVKSSTANVAENKPYTQLIPLKPATPTSDNNAVKAPGSTTTDSSKGEAQESVFSKKDVLEEIRDSILKVQENTKDIFEFLKNSKDKNKTKTVEKEKEKEKEETDEDGRGPGTQLFDSIADFLGDSGSGDSKKSGKKSGSKKSSTRYRDAKGRFTKKPQGIIGRAAQAVRNVGAKIGGSNGCWCRYKNSVI